MSSKKDNGGTVKQMSCYLNEKLKYALDIESSYYKYKGDEERSTINKNLVFIIEQFIDSYLTEPEKVEQMIVRILGVKSFAYAQRKKITQILDIKLNSYPLKFTDKFNEKVENFIVNYHSTYGFKFQKIHLYNLILLNYYMEHKVEIAKNILEFLSNDYFRCFENEGDFSEVIQLFKELMKEGNDEP